MCREFNWDADGRDMEMVRRERAVVAAIGCRARIFRVALHNTRRCMMIRREKKEGRVLGSGRVQAVSIVNNGHVIM